MGKDCTRAVAKMSLDPADLTSDTVSLSQYIHPLFDCSVSHRVTMFLLTPMGEEQRHLTPECEATNRKAFMYTVLTHFVKFRKALFAGPKHIVQGGTTVREAEQITRDCFINQINIILILN